MKVIGILSNFFVVVRCYFGNLDGYSYRHMTCVGPGYTGQITFRCPSTYYMVIRSAFYARLPVNAPAFCDQPAPDNGHRGDCVPHADTDRDNIANSCNTYDNCVLDYPSRSYRDTISSCSRATGPVYLNVGYDCLARQSIYCC